MNGRKRKSLRLGSATIIGLTVGFSFGLFTNSYVLYISLGLVLGLLVDWNRKRM
ncbi:hypothetical protein [Shouchella miscanthi]|uniref:Uncharacterized protein n=1 Tax=Shouchella miscanthi TaxID=2598861 RepID=A0ABU6NHX2_9BACI|nr:hypothetical protein [Shouchella miscanthi]MED4127803.1 hypothetical protein [Shouchella miscanthi]